MYKVKNTVFQMYRGPLGVKELIVFLLIKVIPFVVVVNFMRGYWIERVLVLC